MKHLLLASLAVATVSATASAQLQFRHTTTVDLASTATVGAAHHIGTNPSAIAWDGTNMMVAGWTLSGVSPRVAIVRVSTPLTAPSFGVAFGAVNAPAANRGYSGVVTDANGRIGAAYDAGGAVFGGISFFSPSGVPLWTLPARGSSGVDLDPGFSGVDAGLSYLEIGSPRRRLVNPSNGLVTYTGTTGMSLSPVGFLSTSWRDHAYDPATGDLYTRSSNDVFRHVRTGGNAVTNSVLVNATDATAIVGQNIEFLDTAQGGFVIYNDRTSTAADQLFTNAVKVVRTDGQATTFNLAGVDIASGTGWYDFAWDATTARLAILDCTNRLVHVLELCAQNDADADGTIDCLDGCPADPLKLAPGACGCGVADSDSDGDGTPDCNDGCPSDPAKTAPGFCGCGVPEADTDLDGTSDCADACPNDPLKVAPGACGCGASDVDADADGTADCNDQCPGSALDAPVEADLDGDGVAGCNDACPNDPLKLSPGACGCGVMDSGDSNGNGTLDCAEAIVRLSQVYGAGGNTYSLHLADYIELYNAGGQPQSLAGWSVQYATATSTGTWSVTQLAGTIPPRSYYLIKLANGTGLSAGSALDLPTPDATGTLNMAADNFKVALSRSTVPLTGALPVSTALVDILGTGTANGREPLVGGTSLDNAAALNTNNALARRCGGAQDTNRSAADWGTALPTPRNSTVQNFGLSVTGLVQPTHVKTGAQVRIVASATNDLDDALTAATYSVDLSPIGGSATHPLVDDGTNGDELAGDGLYSSYVTIGSGTTTGTKYLRVRATTSTRAGGALVGLIVASSAAPANDSAHHAVALVGTYPLAATGTLAGSLPEYNAIAQTGTTGSLLPNVAMTARRGQWYSFVGTGNTMTVDTCASLPAFDSVLQVLGGTPDALTVVAVADDSVGCGAGANSRATFCSVAGAPYYAWVSAFSAAASTATYTITVTDGAACSGAVPVMPVTMDLASASIVEGESTFGPEQNNGCDANTGRFVSISASYPATRVRGTARHYTVVRDTDWYRFQALSSDVLQATVRSQGECVVELRALDALGSCVAQSAVVVQSAAAARGASATVSAGVTAGAWYALRVVPSGAGGGAVFGGYAPSGTGVHYTLDVQLGGPPINDTCATPRALPLGGVVVAGNTSFAASEGSAGSCAPLGADV
jgi:hypothetical protein